MTRTPNPTRSADRWFTVVDGIRLRQLRRQRGLTAAELAGEAGIGLSTVLRLEGSPGGPAGPARRPASRPRWASLRPSPLCGQPSPGHAAR
jgi:DNA-binding XRE family transcriptional regulator